MKYNFGTASFAIRSLVVAAATLLFLSSPAFSSTDFSGTWVLDLRASNSLVAILKRLGASWIERRFGDSLPLEATYTQTPDLLTIQLRGLGFQRTDIMRIDSGPERKEDSLFGLYTIRTFWSESETRLVSDISLRTKDSRDGQMTIVRELTDGGKTLIVNCTLRVAGEPKGLTLRRVWRKADLLSTEILTRLQW